MPKPVEMDILGKTKAYILLKLINRRAFGKNHIPETDLKKSIVPFKCSVSDFNSVIKELRNDGFIGVRRKKEIDYYLIPSKIHESREFIYKILGFRIK